MSEVRPNDQMILICGDSGAGKSAALRNLKNVVIFNCEAGKRLPFKPVKGQHVSFSITDPMTLPAEFDKVAAIDQVETIVIDGLNFLMDMYESQYVLTASDTQKAWGEYQQYFKRFMQEHVARTKKNVIFTAHIKEVINKKTGVARIMVPVKGALLNHGVEAYFTTVLGAKKVRLFDLEPYKSDMLNITPQDEAVQFKYVLQTLITADTTDERIRSPMGLFAHNETYIDNDANLVLNRMHDFYADY